MKIYYLNLRLNRLERLAEIARKDKNTLKCVQAYYLIGVVKQLIANNRKFAA